MVRDIEQLDVRQELPAIAKPKLAIDAHIELPEVGKRSAFWLPTSGW
ncbi:MAG: hypothetical protein WDO74_08860 [Pseudomonadota bacterium]